MNVLNKYQLQLEELKIEALALPAFLENVKLTDHLEEMESYLRPILNEFEKYNPTIEKGEQIELNTLERLDEFTGSTHRTFEFEKRKMKQRIVILLN